DRGADCFEALERLDNRRFPIRDFILPPRKGRESIVELRELDCGLRLAALELVAEGDDLLLRDMEGLRPFPHPGFVRGKAVLRLRDLGLRAAELRLAALLVLSLPPEVSLELREVLLFLE